MDIFLKSNRRAFTELEYIKGGGKRSIQRVRVDKRGEGRGEMKV